MPNRADFFVSFGAGDSALRVKCVLAFDEPVLSFKFSLSTLLTIDSITANPDSAWEKLREFQPQWQHKSNEFEISGGTEIAEITIEYHGTISGWCNVIEDRRIALSSYSAWAISPTSTPIDALYKFKNMEDYFIVNARYDDMEKAWIYGETDHDPANIIALKKGHYLVNTAENFNCYYLDNEDKSFADSYTRYYTEIMNYYISEFPPKYIGKMDIVFLGMSNGAGAYFRKELVVVEKTFPEENAESVRRSSISLLSHELGHNWFTGADSTTWEDWLNETGAEWAALLYILSINDTELFDSKIKWLSENYKDTPTIKQPDSARPAAGVHTRGTALFYEIYKRYGADTVKTLLLTLITLQEKTTAAYLTELKSKVNVSLCQMIEQALTATDYSKL